MGMNDTNFIKACRGTNDAKVPVWIMRQAGRYLPEYRAVRQQTSFLDLCRTPELIEEVVRQPVERFGFDAAILFSDILTVLEPMGVPVKFPEGGPQLQFTISNDDDVSKLKDFDIEKELWFVLEGIRRIKKTLPGTPLIGFCGSPFTLACYLIEGKGTHGFEKAKRFLHSHPKAAEQLITLLGDVLSKYLEAQINAGADVVQIFESWGGILSHEDFERWSAHPLNEIFTRLESKRVPRILFVNNVAPYFDLVEKINCDVVGVDYRVSLAEAGRALSNKAIQGNLDPAALFGSAEHVAELTNRILNSFPDTNRLIFNLGHGIQPETPIESVEAVVRTVHNFRN
jgi:uroporphyrinogen decarboxylase